jgi:signal transduction histidine kinase
MLSIKSTDANVSIPTRPDLKREVLVMKVNWNLAYTPYIWPMLSSTILSLVLGVYAWKRRAIAGSIPFAIMMLFMMLWSFGATLQLAAVDFGAKIFWYKFTSIMRLPAATAELCFALQYAGFERLLNRRNLILLSTPPFIVLILALTNNFHHLLWQGFSYDGALHPLRSTLTIVFVIYSSLLATGVILVFLWLFIQSQQHRWIVALILAELVIARLGVVLEYTSARFLIQMDWVTLLWNAGAILYAAVLFGLRMFDPIPLAIQTAIAQMREGMLVLDPGGIVISLNPAAQTILQSPGRHSIGKSMRNMFPIEANREPPSFETDMIEIDLGNAPDIHHYLMENSALKDWRGRITGRLLMLHDLTKQKQAQAQLIEQQRLLTIMNERERLARELHDGIAQLLGYVDFQVEAVSKLVSDGQADTAILHLDRLAEITREANSDLRKYILGLRTALSPDQPFFTAVRHYLDLFTRDNAIQAALQVDKHLNNEPFCPEVRMQVFRIIQEALSNVRKHSHARSVEVTFTLDGQFVNINIQDDGVGFDTKHLPVKGENHFGLRFMCERAEELGGCLQVTSSPHQGTRVFVQIPEKADKPLLESEARND